MPSEYNTTNMEFIPHANLSAAISSWNRGGPIRRLAMKKLCEHTGALSAEVIHNAAHPDDPEHKHVLTTILLHNVDAHGIGVVADKYVSSFAQRCSFWLMRSDPMVRREVASTGPPCEHAGAEKPDNFCPDCGACLD